jgi:predicted secreted protein
MRVLSSLTNASFAIPLATFTFALAPTLALAAPLTATGVLRNQGGGPVADGSYGIFVRLFANKDAAKPLWEEPLPAVKVEGGLFALQLGAGSVAGPAPQLFADNPDTWLEVQVGGDPPLPKAPLHAVAYAMASASASGLHCKDCVKADQIATGAVTSDKVAFAYAASAGKGGEATGLSCIGCIKGTHLDPALLADYAKADALKDYVKDGALAKLAYSGAWGDVAGKPNLHKVAASADYGDLGNKPTLAVLDAKCPDGQFVRGLGPDGKPVCGPDQDTKYSGKDFALANQACDKGKVVTGIGADGKPTCADLPPAQATQLWAQEGEAAGNQGLGKDTWKVMQSVDVPAAGKYLILANYRLRQNGNQHGFVKALVQWEGKTTEARMIYEGFTTAGANFNNMGGEVAWVIETSKAGKVEVAYQANYNAIYDWVNNGNGVPRVVAMGLAVNSYAAESSAVSGNTDIPNGAQKVLQSFDLPAAGSYLIIANYRIRQDGNQHGFVKAMVQWEGKTSEHRMIYEGFTTAGSNFNNMGGTVSWVIAATKAGTADIAYEGAYNKIYSWVNDGNGVPRVVVVKL